VGTRGRRTPFIRSGLRREGELDPAGFSAAIAERAGALAEDLEELASGVNDA